MPNQGLKDLSQELQAYSEPGKMGLFGVDVMTGTGNQTPPAGYVYFAVMALGSAAEFGASCTKYGTNGGDVMADGVPAPLEVIVPIGPHEQLQFDTNADYVLGFLIPAP